MKNGGVKVHLLNNTYKKCHSNPSFLPKDRSFLNVQEKEMVK
jgi:hypothetical protein